MIILRSLIVAEESKLVFISVKFISRKLSLLGFALVGLAGHIGQEVLYPVCMIIKLTVLGQINLNKFICYNYSLNLRKSK